MKFLKLGLFAAAATAALVITASAAGTTNIDGGTVSVSSSLNMRSEPSQYSQLVDSAANGSKVVVVSDAGDGWYEVYYNGKTGYMSQSYVNLGAVDADFGAGYIDGTNVNVRAEANTESMVVTQFSTGKSVNIIGVSGVWYKVTDGTYSGYIRSDFVNREAAKGTVSGAGVRMRSAANTGSQVLVQYDSGVVLDLLGLEGDWYMVSDGTNVGYMHKDYIAPGGSSSAVSYATLSVGQKIVDTAMKYLGVPYVYGGTSPSCFDCSGLVYYVYRENGYSITRRASTIWYDGVTVSKDQLQVGDCVFFSSDSSSSIEHVGIYIGNGQFIHASSGGGCVKINNLSDAYYLRNYYGACRVL